MLRRAPVALRWTRRSLDLASRVNGPNAVDRAILFLLSSTISYIGGRRTVSGEVGNASHCITLNFHILTCHESYQRI